MEIPLNISDQIANDSALTWENLTHIFEFIKNMTKNWKKIS